MTTCLDYGLAGRLTCELDSDRVVFAHSGPPPLADVRQTLRAALQNPLGFPAIHEAIVPGDRVTLALDRNTPAAAQIVAELWGVLEQRQVEPGNVTILQPASLVPTPLPDPRTELPGPVSGAMKWKIHDPTAKGACQYLATSAAGDRLYLASEVVEADVLIPVGRVAFDPLLGYRGTNAVLYPGLSSVEALAKAHGQGHQELGPDDERPLRQMMDEVAWLLGVQFSIQVIAAAGGGASEVLAGSNDAVLRRARELLNERWRVRLDERADVVVAAVDAGPEEQTWEQVGTALEAARNVVSRGGRIVLLTEFSAVPGEGVEIIRRSETPLDALKPLRKLTPPDLIAATQLAHAAEWAGVYLLSRLQGDFVEELFMVPLENEREVQRLLSGGESCVFIGGAQHTWGEVR